MSLIGEAGGRRRLGREGAVGQQRLSPADAHHHQIGVRGRSKHTSKPPQQGELRHAGGRGRAVEAGPARDVDAQELAGRRHRTGGTDRVACGHAVHGRAREHRAQQLREQLVVLERVGRGAQAPGGNPDVGQVTGADELHRTAGPVLGQQRGGDVDRHEAVQPLVARPNAPGARTDTPSAG